MARGCREMVCQCCLPRYRNEPRTRCTTQVRMVAIGLFAGLTSGRPFRPTQHTLHVSMMPRFLQLGQHIHPCSSPSPSVGPIHMPRCRGDPRV